MITTTTWREIADAMVTRLQPLVIGGPATVPAPVLRVADWYAGEFSSPEAMAASNIVGRCPVALVDFLSERVLRTMARGQRQLVETTLAVVCASDSLRSRQAREQASMDVVATAVRAQLHGQRFGLSIQGLHYAGLQLLVSSPTLVAYACRFTTRHHIDPAAQSSDRFDALMRFTGNLYDANGSLEVPLQTDPPQEP